MTSELADSIKRGQVLGKTALYFGCWNGAGHYLHDVHGSTARRNIPSDMPWDHNFIDTGLLKNGKVPDVPDGKVYWTCGGRDAFWYAFYWWDRSVDKRGACNSGLYVRGFDYPEPQAALEWACSQFPHVVARQHFPLALQVNWRGERHSQLTEQVPA